VFEAFGQPPVGAVAGCEEDGWDGDCDGDSDDSAGDGDEADALDGLAGVPGVPGVPFGELTAVAAVALVVTETGRVALGADDAAAAAPVEEPSADGEDEPPEPQPASSAMLNTIPAAPRTLACMATLSAVFDRCRRSIWVLMAWRGRLGTHPTAGPLRGRLGTLVVGP
jgi:hypothetical protein